MSSLCITYLVCLMQCAVLCLGARDQLSVTSALYHFHKYASVLTQAAYGLQNCFIKTRVGRLQRNKLDCH